jgi:hypothetical protein
MRIFISWSGEASHEVAVGLKHWLPNLFQAIKAEAVFLSSQDIEKGTPWFVQLERS